MDSILQDRARMVTWSLEQAVRRITDTITELERQDHLVEAAALKANVLDPLLIQIPLVVAAFAS